MACRPSLIDTTMPSAIHILPYLATRFGGPVTAAGGMAAGLRLAGVEARIVGLHGADEGAVYRADEAVPVEAMGELRWGALRHSEALWRWLQAVPADVFHSHGLWTDVHRAAACVARRRGIPNVIGPCGMLMPHARRRSWWKKWPAWVWFQGRALRQAACVVANSELERRGIRACGCTRPVALVPNPVMPPPAGDVVSPARLIERFPAFAGRTVLFLGRIHPVKGPIRLVQAWGRCRTPGWTLVLAGPDEGGHLAEVRRCAAELGVADAMAVVGPLDDRWKWAALDRADVFVLPSDFENFGMAAAEAMLAGTPVVATQGTPWETLPGAGAGWWVPTDPGAIAGALSAAMAMDDATRREMGTHARALAEGFTPLAVGRRLRALYEWTRGQAPQPDYVD